MKEKIYIERSTSDAEDEYYPSKSKYVSPISVEQWKMLLQDREVTPPSTLAMLKSILDLGGEATCIQLAQHGEHSAWSYTAQGMNFGKRIKRKLNLPDFIDQGVKKYFVIPFIGRYINGGKHYAWKLRKELKQALEEVLKDFVPSQHKFGQNIMEKNIILYGPPGTGKTYFTHIYAVAIIEERSIEEIYKEQYEDILARFKQYRQEGLIEFVTFHQSYSYEDFIEGIRPVILDDESSISGNITYRVEAGIFKQFCDKAATENFTESLRTVTPDLPYIHDSAIVWKVSLAKTGDNPVRSECLQNNHIRIGWDEYGEYINENESFQNGGKTILDAFINKMKIGDIIISCYGESITDAIGIVTGEYEWHDTYKEYKRTRKVNWIVKDIRQNILEINNGLKMTTATVYQMRNINTRKLLDIIQQYIPNQTIEQQSIHKNRVFIIDEINRGNISGIFGELITLIEPSKRLGARESMEVRLPYSRQTFGVPDNIYILGTMNTADRSLTGLDIALRRRFSFKKMSPQPHLLANRILGDSGYSVADMLIAMNRRISILLDHDHCIGHAPFLKLTAGDVSLELAEIFTQTIIPLLEEYFFDDWEKIRIVLNDHKKETLNIQFIIQSEDSDNFFDAETLANSKGWIVNDNAFSQLDSYIQIIHAMPKI